MNMNNRLANSNLIVFKFAEESYISTTSNTKSHYKKVGWNGFTNDLGSSTLFAKNIKKYLFALSYV